MVSEREKERKREEEKKERELIPCKEVFSVLTFHIPTVVTPA